jgi:hypothetical protein
LLETGGPDAYYSRDTSKGDRREMVWSSHVVRVIVIACGCNGKLASPLGTRAFTAST